ncbi:MAG: universal stress protein [Actinomycetota bacterium]|nr:universal stress protein [Actinomycetota bacterium]
MPYASVVVGTDGSDTAEQAVRAAAEVAGSHGARLVIVAAYDADEPPAPASDGDAGAAGAAPEVRAAAGEAAARGLTVAGETEALRAEARAEAGPAAEVLLAVAEAEGADLIVVGSRGMTGAARLTMGAVAGTISHHATCDVLIVHTTG